MVMVVLYIYSVRRQGIYPPSIAGLKRSVTLSLSPMSYTEKIDVLDLLIEILQEHEKRIDELVARLELLVDRIEGEKSFTIEDRPLIEKV